MMLIVRQKASGCVEIHVSNQFAVAFEWNCVYENV